MCYKADHKQVAYSTFKGPPYRNCNMQVLCFQRGQQLQFEGNLLSKGPQMPLKCVSTLLLNFIEGAPERNCSVQVLCFQRGPNSNCNL